MGAMNLLTPDDPEWDRSETCTKCGTKVALTTGGTWWMTDDQLWRLVYGTESGIRCIPCFTVDAAAAGYPVSWRAYDESGKAHAPCESEMYTGHYYRQQVAAGLMDYYWMRCDRTGPHDEHENSETGATWKDDD